MAQIFSTINLKGGVGKTTTTVALAETLSADFEKKVLVIDLDPQTNATTMLIGEKKWRKLNDAGRTLAQLFKDALEPDNKQFDFDTALQKGVSDVKAARTVDLLPSSLDLIDVQDKLASTPSGKFYSINPIELLWRAVKARLDDYDIVIVDCPPNLGIITLNGLRISHGYIIPTIPDIMSTYGIPQIITRIKEFSDEIAEPVEPLGIVISKYRIQTTVHVNGLRRLREEAAAGKGPAVFDAIIPEAGNIAGAAEIEMHGRTLKQKYGGVAEAYQSLAESILTKLEG